MKIPAALIRELSPALLRPPPRLTVSQWAENYRVLSSESSASPGCWYNNRTPYLVGIMDAFNDPSVEIIVFQKSAQVGGSEALLNILGYIIQYSPCPVLMVQPTIDGAESFSRERVVPFLRDCPSLKERVKTESDKFTMRDRVKRKIFTGGSIVFAGANSSASLASRPIRVLLLDELDLYPVTSTGPKNDSGDVVALAIKRTTTFHNRKIIMISTPKHALTSRIAKAYQASDQRRYFVPCPQCNYFQVLQFGGKDKTYGLKWEKDAPLAACYECENCHALLQDGEKQRMLLCGEWRATNTEPYPANVRGFHCNELISPFRSWGRVAADFLAACHSPEQLQAFTNQTLGEAWQEPDETVADTGELRARAEDYTKVPAPVKIITAGFDLQGTYAQAEVVGWGPNFESWGLEHAVFPGDPSQPQLWEDIDRFLTKSYARADGGQQRIFISCFDTGFMSDQVYRFVIGKAKRRIFGIKGVAGFHKSIIGNPLKNQYSRSLKIYPVGSDAVKQLIFAHLAIEDDDGAGPYMHFPRSYPPEYYDQLTAEKLLVVKKGGQPTRRYKKIRDRNEALDCRVYARAALELVHADLETCDVLDLVQTGELAPAATTAQRKGSPGSAMEAIIETMKNRQRNAGRDGRSFVNSWR